jgi:DNA-binding beta-propeller fold protein YncE
MMHASFAAALLTSAALGAAIVTQAPPAFQVDPLWPRPLPTGWILGSVTGIAVDSRDHVWVLHRGADSLTARTENGLGTDPPSAELCCRPAPPVLEFDGDGTLVNSWGGPGEGYQWPATPGGIAVDPDGSVWITAAGWPEPPAPGGGRGGGRGGTAPATPARPHDAHLLKFSPTGKFLQQIGRAGTSEGPSSQTTLDRPAHLAIGGDEMFVADGYGAHRRVVVLDAKTGAYRRHWGAYGAPPSADAPPAYAAAAPPAKQFRAVSCVAVARDGLVYVCDRPSNRIQVFRRDGTFVREGVVARDTLGFGSAWSVALSSDAGQRWLFVADGQNHRVTVLSRDSLAVVAQLGAGGRWPGTFFAVGSVAMDSRGHLYTGEAFEGKRVQKFVRRP